LMPLPLTVSCFSKIQIGLTFLVPAHLGSPGKGPLNGCVCVLQHNTAHWDTYNMNDKPFFVCSKTDGIQLNLLHGNKNKNRKSKGNKLNVKADMLRRNGTGQWSTVKHFLVSRLLNEAIGQQLDHLQQKNVE